MTEIIFDEEKKDYKPLLKKVFYFSLFSLISYLSFMVIIFVDAGKEIKITKDNFFQKSPDLIVVFTGDEGRISLSLDRAKKFNQSNIFITGVYGANSVESLIKPMKLSTDIQLDFLKIDYFARNTVENVISTLRFLNENKGFKNILVITSDYHIYRVKMIFDHLFEQKSEFKIYYEGVTTDILNWRNFKISFKEVFKSIRTYFFLKLWISDTEFLAS